MLSYNRNIKYKSLYNRLDAVCKAFSVRMLAFSHGQAIGSAVEMLGSIKEVQAYEALLLKLVEQKEKELEARGWV